MFADYPLLVSILLVLLVGAHYWAAQVWPVVNVAQALADSEVPDPRDSLMQLALGVASVAAMVGGFAGVVVVFGLGSEHDRFRLLRLAGQRRLRANWISVVLSSFAGAFGAVIASVVIVGFGVQPGIWTLEACLLLAAHGAVRLTALLAGLARIVDEGDQDHERNKRVVATSTLITNKSASNDEET